MNEVWGVFEWGDCCGYFASKELCLQSLILGYGKKNVEVVRETSGGYLDVECIAYPTKISYKCEKALIKTHPEFAKYDFGWPKIHKYRIDKLKIHTTVQKIS